MLFESHYLLEGGGADRIRKNKNVFAFEESLCQSPIFNNFGAMDTKNSLWGRELHPQSFARLLCLYLLVCVFTIISLSLTDLYIDIGFSSSKVILCKIINF